MQDDKVDIKIRYSGSICCGIYYNYNMQGSRGTCRSYMCMSDDTCMSKVCAVVMTYVQVRATACRNFEKSKAVVETYGSSRILRQFRASQRIALE